MESNTKVTAAHLKRNAFLYVRQSSMRQVIEHAESANRQYGLRKRAEALGWSAEQVIVTGGLVPGDRILADPAAARPGEKVRAAN